MFAQAERGSLAIWTLCIFCSYLILLLFEGVKSRKTGESAKAEKSGFIGEFYNFTGRVRILGRTTMYSGNCRLGNR